MYTRTSLIAALVLVGLHAHADDARRFTAREILDGGEALELFSIDPGIHAQFGRTYKSDAGPLADALDALDEGEGVHGHVAIADAAVRAELTKGLVAGLAGPGEPAHCYAPRHAFVATRAGQRAVFHLCFQCGYAVVLDGSTAVGQYAGFGPAPDLKRRLDAILDAAAIPLAERLGDKPPARPAATRDVERLDAIVSPALRAFFETADSLELYAIDERVYATWGYGGATDPSPLATALASLDQGKGVFGKTPIRRAAVRRDVLERLWDGAGNTDRVAKCYEPRHALVATKGADRAVVFLCFACFYVSPIARETAKGALFEYGDVGGLKPLFERLLARRGVKR